MVAFMTGVLIQQVRCPFEWIRNRPGPRVHLRVADLDLVLECVVVAKGKPFNKREAIA